MKRSNGNVRNRIEEYVMCSKVRWGNQRDVTNAKLYNLIRGIGKLNGVSEFGSAFLPFLAPVDVRKGYTKRKNGTGKKESEGANWVVSLCFT